MRLTLILTLFIFVSGYSQETYTMNCTTYYVGQYYSIGLPKVKRNEGNKKKFLDSLGLKETPNRYEIDHVIPLYQGGSDECENMQMLTVEEHRVKTLNERKVKKK